MKTMSFNDAVLGRTSSVTYDVLFANFAMQRRKDARSIDAQMVTDVQLRAYAKLCAASYAEQKAKCKTDADFAKLSQALRKRCQAFATDYRNAGKLPATISVGTRVSMLGMTGKISKVCPTNHMGMTKIMYEVCWDGKQKVVKNRKPLRYTASALTIC